MLKKLSSMISGFFGGSKAFGSPRSGWSPLAIHEPFEGAWQRNLEQDGAEVSTFFAIFSCVSLISKDMGKMSVLLKKRQRKVLVDAKIPQNLEIVMRKPNNFQTWQQFNEFWTTSLLLRGNAFIFKVRDVFGHVVKLVVLDPDSVSILISDDGKVFYRVGRDKMNGFSEEVTIPASEMIHDRINAFYHPMVGMSPIMACGASAGVAMSILRNQQKLFKNGSRPGGILVAPGPIDAEKAKTLQDLWNSSYAGENVGKTAVLGDDLRYTPLSVSAVDSQVVEQLKLSAEVVCTVFHVPPQKIGLSGGFTGKASDLNEIYYSDCVQAYVESRENLLDDGLDLKSYGVEAFLDTDALIRMDKESKIAYLKTAISAGIMSPNEARAEVGLLPVKGGESPVMQQQNYSLEALAKRDSKDDPFSKDQGGATNGASDTGSA